MLRKLTLGNFYSFADEQTVSFAVAKNATDPDGRFARPITSADERFPKVAAVFGANASGKTNLLKALSFLKEFVVESADWPRENELPFLNFTAQEFWEMPTFLAVEVDGELVPEGGRSVFRYEVRLAPTFDTVLNESLVYVPDGRKRRLFVREGNAIKSGKDFGLPPRDPVRRALRPNASVISTLAKFNHPLSMAILEAVRRIQTNVSSGGRFRIGASWATEYFGGNAECLDDFVRQIGRFDLGIDAVEIEKAKEERLVRFRHRGLSHPVELVLESQGTVAFFKVYPLIWYALQSGGVAILDELDNDIHPLVLPEIVRLFQDRETNPHNAQLVMSCHNATLLEHLTKEEVFFTEKDDRGRSVVYGLKDVQGVRRDSNIYAKYLSGVYGGVPRVA